MKLKVEEEKNATTLSLGNNSFLLYYKSVNVIMFLIFCI